MALQNFLQELKNSKHKFQLAKSHLFQVEFYFGSGVSSDQQMVSLLCHQVTMPGQHITTQPAMIQGLRYEVPVGIQQDDLMCSFYVDRNFQIPQIFDVHRSKIVSQYLDGNPSATVRGSYLFDYKDTYKIDIVVKTFDVTNKDSDIKSITKYHNCFVKSQQAMNFDYQNTQIQLMSLIIDFEHITKVFSGLETTPANPGPEKQMNLFLNRTTSPLNFDTLREIAPDLAATYQSTTNTISKVATSVEQTIKSFF